MNAPETRSDELQLTPEEKARRSKRNRAIALGLGGLCVLFYLITLFKMGPAILHRNL